MSYEYARIPLKPGLNFICGPNGSGKSSILLALSVALGQAYTERSRKLSDLIRRGKNAARVTILIDNTKIKGRRPIPDYDSDLFRLSRYLNSDGNYWYEADYKDASKSEVLRFFNNLGINPDNILIIMHQNMIEEFSLTPSNQKLRMVEDAIGFSEYREKISEAQNRLTTLVSEEHSISGLLQNSEQTLTYWKTQYDRYLRKREFLKKKEDLARELVWAHVIRQEKLLQKLRSEFARKTDKIVEFTRKIDDSHAKAEKEKNKLIGSRVEFNKIFYAMLADEKEKSVDETFVLVTNEFLNQLEQHKKTLSDVVENISEENNRQAIKDQELKIRNYMENMRQDINRSKEKASAIQQALSKIQTGIGLLQEEIDNIQDAHIQTRIIEATLAFKKELLEEDLARINREIKESEQQTAELVPDAKKTGPRFETSRLITEIGEELKIVSVQLSTLDDVSEQAETMYKHYHALHKELKEKAEVVTENREKAVEEIETRKATWNKVVTQFLEKVNDEYQKILSHIGALGNVRLTAADDLEHAGLELRVGFRGTAPVVLDAHTQSGGERTTAVMSFLLALQSHVKSPIRAVDEFDVHMDPRSRESMAELLISSLKGNDTAQYIIISPGQIPVLDETVHFITVQNVSGRSNVKEVA